jgi:hypothetical protein
LARQGRERRSLACIRHFLLHLCLTLSRNVFSSPCPLSLSAYFTVKKSIGGTLRRFGHPIEEEGGGEGVNKSGQPARLMACRRRRRRRQTMISTNGQMSGRTERGKKTFREIALGANRFCFALGSLHPGLFSQQLIAASHDIPDNFCENRSWPLFEVSYPQRSLSTDAVS